MKNIRPWFSEDIGKVVKSVLFATRESGSQEYRRGFLACALAICLAIGIEPSDILPHVKDRSQDGKADSRLEK